MSNKARYYLEQCIPEIKDLVEKQLFTKNEASKIMKKRTDFEHRLNSRGSSINDYIKYIEYEQNVNKLRLKRVKRILKAQRSNSISDWSIEQRIVFIFQRGCNKFPKELKFWSLYLNYLKTQGKGTSYRKIHQVYNQLLKLHPANVDIWISCAKYEYETHANFKSCRTLFQNSLRFNPDVPKLWFEYVKFELNFIEKLINRRKVMKLISEREQEMDMLTQQRSKNEQEGEIENEGIQIPSTGDMMKDKLNEFPEVNINMLGNEDTNPALCGDVALSIYDLAMKTLTKYYINKHQGYHENTYSTLSKEVNLTLMEYLFDKSMEYIKLFDKFPDLRREYLINHILKYLRQDYQGLTFEKDLPNLYLEYLIQDITLNIKYMKIENLDIEKLKLSVNKYFAYKHKMTEESAKKLAYSYSSFLNETFLSLMDKDNDVRYAILNSIIKKL